MDRPLIMAKRHDKNHPAAPLARFVLAGIVLTAVPILSLLTHLRNTPDDHVLVIPAMVTEALLGPRLSIDMTTVNVTELAGDDSFAVGDIAYVHNAVDGTQLLYPFAISQSRASRQAGTVSLRGIVTAVNGANVTLDYQFEDLASRAHLVRVGDTINAELSVNTRAVVRLKAIIHDGQRTPYDLMEKPVLFGRTIKGAKTAPAM